MSPLIILSAERDSATPLENLRDTHELSAWLRSEFADVEAAIGAYKGRIEQAFIVRSTVAYFSADWIAEHMYHVHHQESILTVSALGRASLLYGRGLSNVQIGTWTMLGSARITDYQNAYSLFYQFGDAFTLDHRGDAYAAR